MRLAILDDYQRVALAMADWSSLAGRVDITVFVDTLKDADALAARLEPFAIICLMRERTPITRGLINRLPKLQHIFTSGTRNSSIDHAACRERGIIVTGCPTLDHPTAELTLGLILALARQISREDRSMHAGGWATTIGQSLKGSTLGILGLGRMGAQVASLGQAFGMRVIAWSGNLTAERCAQARVEFAESLEVLLGQADFVSLHLMLGERTRGLIGAAQLAAMKPTAYLINTARAAIVDEAALITALETGQIAGAALDVFECEPLHCGHPLRRQERALLMPHQGYVVEQNYRRFYHAAVENVCAWLDGEIINEVTERTGPATHSVIAIQGRSLA
jgi:phosphoglycerate dehydrogenase-like enzyme